MVLVDTNIWLERLLDQVNSGEVAQFLDRTPPQQIFITDFAFHSIGVVMSRLDRAEDFLRFTRDPHRGKESSDHCIESAKSGKSSSWH